MAPECHIEILMNASEKYIDTLIDTYRVSSEVVYASSALFFLKELKNKTNFPIRFLRLNDAFKEDRTIFVLSEVYYYTFKL